MTLIAGFRCNDGAVICADSQETVGEFRVDAHKLEPFDAGNFQVGIAGSGNDGDLIDGFIQRLEDNLKRSSVATLDDFRQFAQSELLDFSNNEAQCFPVKSRKMSFLICARTVAKPYAFDLWTTSACRLKPIARHALVGWDIPLYKQYVNQFYSTPEKLPISQTIFIALRLFSLASKTSKSISDPITVVVVRDTGFNVQPPELVKNLRERVIMLDGQFQHLMSACPDTSVSPEAFNKIMAECQASITYLRHEYLTDIVNSLIQNLNDVEFVNALSSHLPPRKSIALKADGSIEVQEMTRDEKATAKALNNMAKPKD